MTNLLTRPTPMHRWVATRGYAWGPFLLFVLVRLTQITLLVWLLVWLVRDTF